MIEEHPKKLRPPNEREHIRLIDARQREIRIYKGIPTIIPAGAYSLQDSITEGYYICGEIAEEITWSFKEDKWITLGDHPFITPKNIPHDNE